MSDRNFVLVAEDDRNDLYLLRRAFKKADLPVEIFHVPDGEATIDYLRGTPPFDDRVLHPLPKLLLLDLKLPKLNGLDVLAWLATRPELSCLPAVVLTSSVLQRDAQMATELGAREFLSKPNDGNELIRLVRRLYDRWLACDQPITPAVIGVSQDQVCGSAQPNNSIS